jgi:hypothetical protein
MLYSGMFLYSFINAKLTSIWSSYVSNFIRSVFYLNEQKIIICIIQKGNFRKSSELKNLLKYKSIKSITKKRSFDPI